MIYLLRAYLRLVFTPCVVYVCVRHKNDCIYATRVSTCHPCTWIYAFPISVCTRESRKDILLYYYVLNSWVMVDGLPELYAF
jgi:hypothetical protein